MNVFLPLRKLQTLLICSIFMNISLLALAADPSLLIKDLGEGVEWRRKYGQKSNTRRICRKIKKEKS